MKRDKNVNTICFGFGEGSSPQLKGHGWGTEPIRSGYGEGSAPQLNGHGMGY